MGQERDSRHHETELFARQIMAHINVAHARGEFDRLVVAAEPALLGVLRACLEPRTAAATIDVARNLSHLPDRALESEFPVRLGSPLYAALASFTLDDFAILFLVGNSHIPTYYRRRNPESLPPFLRD